MSPMVRLPLTLEHALLGLLREQPRHGYDLYQRLSDPAGLGLIWRLKQSQLYALLAKLEAEGYLTATLKPQEARPTRRIYRLTPAGRAAYLAWVRSPVPHGRQLRQEFLAKLYFARREGSPLEAELITRQQELCRGWLAAQRALSDQRGAAGSFAWLVSEYRLGQIEAMLAWLDRLPQLRAQRPAEG